MGNHSLVGVLLRVREMLRKFHSASIVVTLSIALVSSFVANSFFTDSRQAENYHNVQFEATLLLP